MRRFSLAIPVIAFALLLALVLPAALLAEEAAKEEVEKVEEPAGKVLFLANKCASCHTAFAAGIGEPPEEKAEAEAEADAEEETGPPDLSEVGATGTAEWLDLFLLKKETIDGKKHMTRFKGSDEERAALVDWLMTLGAPADTTTAEPAVEEPTAEPASESPVEEPAAEPAGESPLEEPAAEPASESPVEEPAAEPASESPLEEPAAEPAGESPVEEPAAEPASESPETEGPTGE